MLISDSILTVCFGVKVWLTLQVVLHMGMFLFNKLWLVMVISTACVVTSAEPKPTHKSRVVDRVYVVSYIQSYHC